MRGHSRSKNGVALLAYVPTNSFMRGTVLDDRDAWAEPGRDEPARFYGIRIVSACNHLVDNDGNSASGGSERRSQRLISRRRFGPPSGYLAVGKGNAPR
jgi:hypothetical protein